MRSDLDNVEAAVASEVAMLTAQDGLTVPQVADLLAYDNPSMVYCIANPEKAQMPTAARFIHAALRLSEIGNTRLARLTLSPRYALRLIRPAMVNRSLVDEHHDLARAFVRVEDALDARDYQQAEARCEEMAAVLERVRAEVAAAKGQNVHQGDGTADGFISMAVGSPELDVRTSRATESDRLGMLA